MKIGILEPSNFSKESIVELSKYGVVELFTSGDIYKFIKNKNIVFVRLNIPINKKLIDAADNLQIICSPTTGLNHIDYKYCIEKGIKIISLKGENTFLKTIRATPEHTLGLLIALKRNYKTAFLSLSNSEWNRDKNRGYEIYNSKIGIIGFGRVGSIVSKYLKSLGATIGFYEIKSIKKDNSLIQYKSIQDLIQNSDTIILSSSYIEQNGIIIGKKEIDAMAGKIFINTARAELTDEKYLCFKAAEGHFSGIAVDVILNEQTSQDNLQLWLKASNSYNVLITPHIGGATYTSMNRTENFIAQKLIQFIGN